MGVNEGYLRRRTILCGTIVAFTAGCLDRLPDGSNTGPTGTDTPKQGTKAQRTTSNFYIENVYFEKTELSLDITNDDSVLVDDEFAIPGSTGVVFQDIGTAGTTYSVSATTTAGDHEVTAEWDVRSCAESEAPKGNTDGGVRFTGEDLLFRENACDAIFIGTRQTLYEDPDKYRV